jgi:hypothetical protein
MNHQTRSILSAVSGALLGLLIGAPAGAQEPGQCFDVVPGPWQLVNPADSALADPPPDQAADSVRRDLPRRIRLLERSEEPSRSNIDVPADALDTPHTIRVWSQPGDSLRISFSTGFAGTTTRLSSDGDRWTGWSRAFADYEPYYAYERPVVLEPVDCSSPPPQRADLDPPLPRRVDFDDAPTLELGRPAPSDWAASRGGEWTGGTTPLGLLAGADSVRVKVTTDGLVREIDLVYAQDFDPTPVRRHLDSLGAQRSEGVEHWRNRTTRVMLRRFDFGRVITLTDPRLLVR